MVVLGKESLSAAMNAKIIGPSSGEAVVLSHGFGADQSIWDKILPCLALSHRVVLFDWSFSGAVKDKNIFDPVKYSSYDAFADDLIVILEELNVKTATFVGHSMSGMIGCIAAVKCPDLFKKLILVGASPRYINTEEEEFGFKRTDVDQLISSIETNLQTWASNFAPLVIDHNDPLSIEKFEKLLNLMSPEAALSTAKVVFYSDNSHILEKIVTPCVIVQTVNDVVVPISSVNYMKKKIKNASTVVEMIETDGHFPQLTAHDQLMEVLNRYITS
ncbi:strigolactone esterase D14-like [Impatiens glandulifera]|uniref:strigolactone esterase D14-like n=1 Tax=Impatiens glandulifera TaxID=253017 RepID=UPI001FB0D9B5|nr:strigolactone esterase D14-like [Impatiens glandulifera]